MMQAMMQEWAVAGDGGIADLTKGYVKVLKSLLGETRTRLRVRASCSCLWVRR